MTGNTVIDALLDVAAFDFKFDTDLLNNIKGRIILITAHRRENFGKPLIDICNAILTLAKRYPEVTFVYPVHLNPNVRNIVYPMLGNLSNIKLIEPLEYMPFVHLMKRACIILTDSGGIQEESPSLNKPVLILREVTERPEAVKAGSAKLVGTRSQTIIRETTRLLEDAQEYDRMTHIANPFGDGRASKRVVDFIKHELNNNKNERY